MGVSATFSVPALPRRPPVSRAPPPTLLQDTLLELFPSEVLQHLADKSGFVKRHRKVDPVAFFWAVTLEAGVYLQRSLEQLSTAPVIWPVSAPKNWPLVHKA